MSLNVALSFVTIATSLVVAIIALPAEGASRTTKAFAVGLLLLAAISSAASAVVEDKEGKAQDAEARKQSEDVRAARSETKAARSEAEATRRECSDSKALSANCARAYQQGRPYSQFYADLSPEEKAGYPVPDCGSLPAVRRGETDIRVAAWPTQENADASLKAIRRILTSEGQQGWSSHVMMKSVESHAFDDRSRKLWVGVIRQVEAGYAERVCSWLSCKGVQFGFENCAARNVHGAPF